VLLKHTKVRMLYSGSGSLMLNLFYKLVSNVKKGRE